MFMLVLGLVLFLSIHSVRLFAEGLRTNVIDAKGMMAWRGFHSLVSLAGLVLIIWGYGMTRQNPVFLFTPPPTMRHLTIPLTWLAFILLTAAYIPQNQIKQRLGHPMYAGIKVWALSHLLANGRMGDVVLFSAFLLWSVAGFAIHRRRDKAAGVVQPPGRLHGTMFVLMAGSVAWVIFAFALHHLLIGVPPF